MAEHHPQATQSSQSDEQAPAQRVMPAHDVKGRAIAWAALGLVGVLILVGLLAYFSWDRLKPAGDYTGPNAAMDFEIDGPKLESAPQRDRKAYEAGKQQQLDSWQWVDREAGIARIPIEQAMQIMAERGQTGATPATPEETQAGWEAVRP